jgi:ferritin-like metal-binding protein YciE
MTLQMAHMFLNMLREIHAAEAQIARQHARFA